MRHGDYSALRTDEVDAQRFLMKVLRYEKRNTWEASITKQQRHYSIQVTLLERERA